MRSLFLRIFLAFWAAMLLVMMSTSVIAWYRLSRYQAMEPGQVVSEAAARMEAEGLPGLRAWIDEAQANYLGRGIYVVDQQGRDVLGRELPPLLRGYLDRLRSAGLLTPGERREFETDPLLLTPQFVDELGDIYTVMLDARGGPIAVMRTPQVRALLFAFALGISGIVCWSLARYISKPVERLQSSTRSLAAGNLEARVGVEFARRRDELGVLARDFDRMADQVRKLIASKEDLLRGMSHELRSPLARLRVAAGLARRTDADVARQLDRIELEAERLDTLIGQMLQLSQLRVIEPTLPRESVDLTALVSEVVDDARLEASAANKGVQWSAPLSVLVENDHQLLRSAIENVLRNAVRFTKSGSSVQVALERRGEDVVVTIQDHGPGVPEAELERIFEPFYRVAESRDRDSGGTGLGLAITSRILALFGGRVRARNLPSGGLSVELRLPVSPAQAGSPYSSQDTRAAAT